LTPARRWAIYGGMTSIGSIAISGLNAAATRLGVAANNLVNAQTSAFATATGEPQGSVY